MTQTGFVPIFNEHVRELSTPQREKKNKCCKQSWNAFTRGKHDGAKFVSLVLIGVKKFFSRKAHSTTNTPRVFQMSTCLRTSYIKSHGFQSRCDVAVQNGGLNSEPSCELWHSDPREKVLPLYRQWAANYIGIWVEVYVASVTCLGMEREGWTAERLGEKGQERKRELYVWFEGAKLEWRRCGCLEEVACEVDRVMTDEIAWSSRRGHQWNK